MTFLALVPFIKALRCLHSVIDHLMCAAAPNSQLASNTSCSTGKQPCCFIWTEVDLMPSVWLRCSDAAFSLFSLAEDPHTPPKARSFEDSFTLYRNSDSDKDGALSFLFSFLCVLLTSFLVLLSLLYHFGACCLACSARHYGDEMIEVWMKWGFLEKIPSLAVATVRRSTEISDNILIPISILCLWCAVSLSFSQLGLYFGKKQS